MKECQIEFKLDVPFGNGAERRRSAVGLQQRRRMRRKRKTKRTRRAKRIRRKRKIKTVIEKRKGERSGLHLI